MYTNSIDMIKNIRPRKESLKLENYVNTETGETLLSEAGNKSSIIVHEDSNYFTVHSEEYIVLDSNAMQYVYKVLSKPDTEKVVRMANMAKTELNILYNNTIPHTLQTLAKSLDFTPNELSRALKRLEAAGVLGKFSGGKYGYNTKVYILNPTVARKRKTFDKSLLELFNDLSTKDGQHKQDELRKVKPKKES